jgi:hypothetical protein
VQPVHLSLLPEEHPAPPRWFPHSCPDSSVTAAVTLLASLIARAAAPDAAAMTAPAQVSGDERAQQDHRLAPRTLSTSATPTGT